jgi:DNA polymerase I-like protein with 3'-5' exonuclease and polymerase domains
MGASTLARQLGCPVFEARDLLSRFRLTFPDYSAWTQSVVAGGCLFGRVRNKLGWPLWVGGDTRPTTLLNFPMQSGGSAMMQAAVILAHRRCVPVVGVVHDALLVECDDADAAKVEIATVRVMRDASALILGGRELRVDTERVTHPNRYVDKRGVEVWRMVLDILDEAAVEAGDLPLNRSVK